MHSPSHDDIVGEVVPKDSATSRVLVVFEYVASNGPCSLSKIVDRLPISRTAIWRALNLLRARGWIRMRQGDNAFEVTRSLASRVANAHVVTLGADAASDLMRAIVCSGPFRVEFGAFDRLGVFTILESTNFNGYQNIQRSLVNDEIAVAAQLGLSSSDIVRNLMHYMEFCSGEERKVICSGEHARRLHEQRNHGIVWAIDGTAFAIPCDVKDISAPALRVELNTITKENLNRLSQMAKELASSGPVNPRQFDYARLSKCKLLPKS